MKRSNYVLAALTSAVLPNLAVAGVRESAQASSTDEAKGIDQAVVQDASGRLYDVYATDTAAGRTRLVRRVKAAQTLAAAREPGGLGFDLDRVIAFAPGDVAKPGQTATAQAFNKDEETVKATATVDTSRPSPTGSTTVLIAAHRDGQSRPLDLLTLDDCAAVGTALGAIHRLSPAFLTAAKYPVFTTGQIRSQLTAWIRRLRSAGHVPTEITNSWARVIETEGLWSFATCTVHGGFSDGDFLFSGSTITAVTNWQDMQVNDPARDLAWIFGKLDESHRNAVLAAYGRMMGSRLDDLIMLRANLWLQMEQVGEFIQAINRGDNDRIMQFKAQVERLAHQLGIISRDTTPAPDAKEASARETKPGSPSTITVGTLLQDDERRGSGTSGSAATVAESADVSDDTPDPDRTGSAEISAAGQVGMTPAVGSSPAADRTADHPLAGTPLAGGFRSGFGTTGSTKPQPSHSTSSPHSSVTITLKELLEMDRQEKAGQSSKSQESRAHSGTAASTGTTGARGSFDGTNAAQSGTRPMSHPKPLFPGPVSLHGPTAGNVLMDADDTGERFAHSSTAKTTVIPLLEREERALRDAHAGLDGYDEDGNPVNTPNGPETTESADTPHDAGTPADGDTAGSEEPAVATDVTDATNGMTSDATTDPDDTNDSQPVPGISENGVEEGTTPSA
ncbi:aminoglycoside phosphotransferase [Bifidobacterium callitrichidarum]|uniref:Aminoglycoside phosphotransferase n=1 Tax=Bifidobacterium callitrichidarum TaxID=2052941 RepID=A0A2U2N5I1_9BIFI|nr:phosphotransferase [Bifidobacterium callitrichidarum]PWG64234.1 aminoglycoside phosphotransferase [Bifidobacterium callitrichidarum]